jgi:hypothetical protein
MRRRVAAGFCVVVLGLLSFGSPVYANARFDRVPPRERIEPHRAIAPGQRFERHPAIVEQHRVIEQRRIFESRPAIVPARPAFRPHDGFFDNRIDRRRFIERRDHLRFRPVIPQRELFPRRHLVERDRRVFVFGSTLFLYPAPLYPYPAPGSPMLLYQPPDVVVPDWAVPDSDICQDFHGDAVIRDTGQRFYGTACLQPDGQ